MKSRKRKHDRSEGYALLIVMVIILTLSVLFGVMHSAGMQRAFMATKLGNRTRALTVAETGLTRTYEVLSQDFDARTNAAAFPSGTQGGGTYTVNVTPVSNNVAVLNVRATYRNTTVDITVDVISYKDGQDVYMAWDPDPFHQMILAGKDMKWKARNSQVGELQVSNGSLHSNGKLKIEGDNITMLADVTSSKEVELKKTTLDGDARAPKIDIDGDSSVTGTTTTDTVPYMAIPDIDLTPYYVEAVKNGQVINGDLRIKKSEVVNINPPGGILWVNGKVTIDGDGTINGCIIATKDIKIKGTVTQTKVNDYPAFVSREKKIEITGSGTYHGLVYAPKGDVNFKKSKKEILADNGSFTGAIIAGKTFKGAGAWSFMAWEDSTPGFPDGSTHRGDYEVIYISAWHR